MVLDSSQVILQMHESIGHPVELDRVLGMEEAYAGTSFLTPDDRGRLRYGSDKVTVVADATLPGGLGTFGFDDEGVPAQRTVLIQDGVFQNFLSGPRHRAGHRGTVHRRHARGRLAEHPAHPHDEHQPRAGRGTLAEIIGDTDDGLYLNTNQSWSIDDKRVNFQFGCEIAWRIEKGKLTQLYRNPNYTGITTEFWGSCDAVGGREEWTVYGTPNCGKGQPGQVARVGPRRVPRALPERSGRGAVMAAPIGPDDIRQVLDAALDLSGADGVEVLHDTRVGRAHAVRELLHPSEHVARGHRAPRAGGAGRPAGRRGARTTSRRTARPQPRRARSSWRASRCPTRSSPAWRRPPRRRRSPGSYDEATASMSPAERAESVAALVGEVGQGFRAAGAFETTAAEIALANTEGQFCYAPTTQATITTVVSGGDGGAGTAEEAHRPSADLDAAAIGRRAFQKARDSQRPQDLEPGPVRGGPGAARGLDVGRLPLVHGVRRQDDRGGPLRVQRQGRRDRLFVRRHHRRRRVRAAARSACRSTSRGRRGSASR